MKFQDHENNGFLYFSQIESYYNFYELQDVFFKKSKFRNYSIKC